MKARSFWLAAALLAPAIVVFAPWLLEGRILSSQDITRVYTPIAALLRECLLTGDPSRLVWNPDLGAGFPLGADGATTPFYVPHWLLLLALPPPHALTAALLLGYAASAIAMGAFARSLGLKAAASVVAGTGYAWSGFAVGHVVHVNMVAGLPFLPIVLIALEHAHARAARGDSSTRPAILAGLAWGLQCLGGHPQTALMTAAIAVVYVAWRFRSRAAVPVVGVFLAIGAGTAAVYYLPMAELASQSVAPGSGLAQPASATYALPAAHLVTAVAPFFFYDGAGEYRGAWNPAEMAFYPGVVILWLAGVALATQWRVPRVRFFAALAAVGLVLALGSATPAHWLLQALPVFRSMRAPARYVLLSDVGLCVLAAFGLEALTGLNARQRRWATSAALGLAAVALGASLLPPTALGSLAGDRWRDAEAGAVSVLWPLRRAWPPILSCAAAAVLAAFADRHRWLTASMTALVVFDLSAFAATALGPQWMSGRREETSMISSTQGGRGKGGRAYVVTSPEPWRGASNRALTDRYSGLDLYVSLPLRRHVDAMQAFWLSDQSAPGVLQAAAVGTVVDAWRRPLDPRARLEDEEWSPRWPIAILLPGQRVRFDAAGFRANSLRLVTALQDAGLPRGAVMATVRLESEAEAGATFDLRAGVETAERRLDDDPGATTLPLPTSAAGWSRIDGLSEGRFYLGRHDWEAERTVTAVEIEYRAPQGRLLLFGGSLRGSSSTRSLTPFMAAPYRRREERDGRVRYELTGTRARAIAVHRVVRVADAKAAFRRLGEPDADVQGTIALETNESPEPTGTGPSPVTIVSDQPRRVELAAEMHGSGYVVLADAYYPGWIAEIDGAPTTVYPADGLFRAVFVPDGAHRVVWRYEPRWLRIGGAITAATLAAATALLLLLRRPAHS